jgi:voltage-gated potassium channel
LPQRGRRSDITHAIERRMLDFAAIAMQNTSNTRLSYELFIGALGIISIILLGCHALPLDQSVREVAFIVNNGIAFIFLFDFFFGLVNAPEKLRYLRTGWLTLLGGIPFMPVLALFRIWRTTNLLRYMHATGERHFFKIVLLSPATNALLSTFLLAIVVVTLSSMLVVSNEMESPDSNIRTGADAVWWSIVTVATVGYGDRYPVTVGGRMIAIALMLVGVGLFSVLSSYLASRFIHNPQESSEATRQEIAALRQQVASLQRAIDRLAPPDISESK